MEKKATFYSMIIACIFAFGFPVSIMLEQLTLPYSSTLYGGLMGLVLWKIFRKSKAEGHKLKLPILIVGIAIGTLILILRGDLPI